MGSRIWKIALVAVAVAFTGCVPPPAPAPPLMVNTTANTFDGVCDEADCSLLDAIEAANLRANPNNLPNEIRVPEGTYVLTEDAPIAITRPVVINGAGRTTTTLDLTDSPVTAPGGVIDPQFPMVISGMRIESNTDTPTHVLASCAGHLPKAVSVISARTSGLAAVSTACDAIFVSTEVIGPASVITPNTIAATSSTLPFADEPLQVRQFGFVASRITGPSAPDGTSTESQLTIQPLDGININGNISASHFDRVGLSLGRSDATPTAGNVFGTVTSSSFDLAAESGPKTVEVQPGSSLRLTQSTIYGGGASGAVQAGGQLILQGATIANAGPAIVVGDAANVMARRSVLSAFEGPVCTAPITSILRNAVVGDSCGTPSATDLVVASHAELQLGDVGSNDSHTPTFSMAPAETSPLVDVIPIEGPGGLDCPFNVVENIGGSLDQRGYLRPSGSACDVGAVEFQYPAPEDPAPTPTIAE